MQLVIISDIFGRTKSFEQLAADIVGNYDFIKLLDPYDGVFMDFVNEEKAYDYFTQNVGLEKYTQQVEETLRGIEEQTLCVGFSVGASALWVSSQNCPSHIKGICFYGSQIRHHLHVNPKCKLICYFPKEEIHFSVDEVIPKIAQKKNVACKKTDYLHGFMNRYSNNFDEFAYKKYLYM